MFPNDVRNFIKSGGDCKTLSFVINCLAKKYNIVCRYRRDVNFENLVKFKMYESLHTGIDCFINKNWTKIF